MNGPLCLLPSKGALFTRARLLTWKEREKDGETDFILFGRVFFFSTELKGELALGQRIFTPPFVSDKIIAPPRCYCEQEEKLFFLLNYSLYCRRAQPTQTKSLFAEDRDMKKLFPSDWRRRRFFFRFLRFRVGKRGVVGFTFFPPYPSPLDGRAWLLPCSNPHYRHTERWCTYTKTSKGKKKAWATPYLLFPHFSMGGKGPLRFFKKEKLKSPVPG